MSPLRLSPASQRIAVSLAQDGPLSKLRYVSSEREESFSRLDIFTVRELLLSLPFRYIDVSSITPIARAMMAQKTTVFGVVDRIKVKNPRPRFSIAEVFINDGSGVLCLTFFCQPWVAQQLKRGDGIIATGTISMNAGFKQISSPLYEVIDLEKPLFPPGAKKGTNFAAVKEAKHAGKESDTVKAALPQDIKAKTPVVPIHHATEGLSTGWMRRIMSEAVQMYGERLDFVPAAFIAKNRLMSEGNAIRQAHFPSSLTEAERARKRLAYDELLCLQLALRTRKELLAKHQLVSGKKEVGKILRPGALFERLKQELPFRLTQSQEKALSSLLQDMENPTQMHRLLLGDVGSGKTILAAFALAAAADSETQGAIMAPTSVLAFQYAEKLGPLFDATGISWCVLTGSTPAKERNDFLVKIKKGEISVVFGTTALLSEDVVFKDLSLVVVDEQHRFGVKQRAQLLKKGAAPDVLSMSATPIPRTLALSIYGDVDVTPLKGRPMKGAGISTTIVSQENLDIAYKAINEAVAAGQQAYVICPLIEPQETNPRDIQEDGFNLVNNPSLPVIPNLTAALPTFERFRRAIAPTANVGLLTGRMTSPEKDRVMSDFYEGKIQILVSTTVVEVGVDVPNATCMLVMDADRFGLATLHQLRGRVGRGTLSGKVFFHTCSKKDSNARQRLDLLEKTNDGSELAELDLKLRHEGDILGYRQSGYATLRLVDLAEDADIIEAARNDALAILSSRGYLRSDLALPLVHEIEERYKYYFEQTVAPKP